MDTQITGLFISGLVLGAGPCMGTCGPLLISFVTANNSKVNDALRIYFIFSLSRILVYLLMTVAMYSLGTLLFRDFLSKTSYLMQFIAGISIIFIGVITVLGKIECGNFLCKMPVLQKKIMDIGNQLSGRNYLKASWLGVIMGLLPCIPLLAVFSYIVTNSKQMVNGLVCVFSFGMGTAFSPLVILVLLAGLFPSFRINKNAAFNVFFRALSGLIIIIIGFRQLIHRAYA